MKKIFTSKTAIYNIIISAVCLLLVTAYIISNKGGFDHKVTPIPDLNDQSIVDSSTIYDIDCSLDSTILIAEIPSISTPKEKKPLENNRPLIKSQADDVRNKVYFKQKNFTDEIVEEIYLADIQKGSIGISERTKFDSPSDNVFLIQIEDNIRPNASYLLTYEIKGISGVHSVNRSINEFHSTGGHAIKSNNGWAHQTELLNPRLIKKGVNSIRFNQSTDLPLNYQVKNVTIKKVQAVENQDLIITSKVFDFTKKFKLYLKGFTTKEIDYLEVNGSTFNIQNGDFEIISDISLIDLDRSYLTIEAFSKGRSIFYKNVAIESDAPETQFAEQIEKSKNIARVQFSFEKEKVVHDGYGIILDESSLKDKTNIIIEKTRANDVAPMGSGLTNVTKNQRAVRCLPHGIKFEKEVTILIPYDASLIPRGFTEKEIQPFYFDEIKKGWIPVKIDSIDQLNDVVYAKTDHFSDYINGVIQTPESPGASAFAPTSMSDVKAASPFAGLNIMAPPTNSSNGDAQSAFPIQIPAGRNGMQPKIALQYSSSGGSSWVGYGWSLAMPSISIDTRWGVPTFDPNYETEIYMLNGQQLIYPGGYLPNRHAVVQNVGYDTDFIEREEDVLFHERRLGSFSKIQRIGSAVNNYVWKVTTSDGTIHWYGGMDGAVHESAILRASGNQIAHWCLRKSVDVHGNTIEYTYDNLGGNETFGNLVGGQNIYIRQIRYTGYEGDGQNETGRYTIDFEPVNNPSPIRKDVTVSHRLGLKQVDSRLLENIVVRYDDQFIRSYDLNWDPAVGRFHKTMLTSIGESIANESAEGTTRIHEHKFTYYDDIAASGGQLFSGAVMIETPCDTILDEEDPCFGEDETIDTDGDLIPDCRDNCPDFYNPLQDTNCEDDPCGPYDSDSDGVNDLCDDCPEVDAPQQDTDGDSHGDACDNCPNDNNFDQSNSDGDTWGNACDNCPNTTNQDQADTENGGSGDGIGNACDNCPDDVNPDQADLDNDGIGDACDNCPEIHNPNQQGTDHDFDLDGVGDLCDNCPYEYNPFQEDSDNDGQGDVCDTDDGCSPDTQAPNAVCQDAAIELDENGEYSNPTIIFQINNGSTDNCRLNSFSISPSSFSCTDLGAPVEVTMTVTDHSGNLGTCTSLVTVSDPLDACDSGGCTNESVPPMAFCYETITVTLSTNASPAYEIQASEIDSASEDNCAISNLDLSFENLYCSDIGETYTITLTVTDYSDNSSTCQTAVVIEGIEDIDFDGVDNDSDNCPCFPNPNQEDTDGDGIGDVCEIGGIAGNQEERTFGAVQWGKIQDAKTDLIKDQKIRAVNARRMDPLDPCPTLEFDWVVSITGSNPNYDSNASMLGTTKSTGYDAGTGLSLGLGCNPVVMGGVVTGDKGRKFAKNNTRSHITHIDMNGDGLTDVVRKKNNILYYQAHEVTRSLNADHSETIEHNYRAPVRILNMNELLRSNSKTKSEYLAGTASFGPFGASIGDSDSKSWGETETYITDANGDGLPDVVNDREVYFNHLEKLDADGILEVPTFTTSSEPTENMIITGKILTNEDLTPDLSNTESIDFPDFDVVKVWEAPSDGDIEISNLTGPIPGNAKVSIESDNSVIYNRNPSNLSGTCRLFHGDLTQLNTLGVITQLPAPVGLNCRRDEIDPCTLDSDCDGINDCLDKCPGSCNDPDPMAGCNDCLPELSITTDVVSGLDAQAARHKIKANNTIFGGASAIYNAGDSVTLNKDFEVKLGGQLLAFVPGCEFFGGFGEDPDPIVVSDPTKITVKKGQRLYFRMHAKPDEENPDILWDPEVKYTSISGTPVNADEIFDNNKLTPFKSSYSNGFKLDGKNETLVPIKELAQASISWPDLEVPILKNDVVFRIALNLVKYKDGIETFRETKELFKQEVPANVGGAVTTASSDPLSQNVDLSSFLIPGAAFFPTATDETAYTTLTFEATASTNVDWQAINWKPELKYTTQETLHGGGSFQISESIFPIVDYSLFRNYTGKYIPFDLPKISHHIGTAVHRYDVIHDYYVYAKIDDNIDPSNIIIPPGESSNSGFITLTVEQNGTLKDSRVIEVNENGIHYPNNSPMPIKVKTDEDQNIVLNLYSDGSYFSEYVFEQLENPLKNFGYNRSVAYISIDGDGINYGDSGHRKMTRRDCNLKSQNSTGFGHFYRGWGQFIYNPSADADINGSNSDGFGALLNIDKSIEKGLSDADLATLTSLAEGVENINTDSELNTLTSSLQNMLDNNSYLSLYVFPTPYHQVVQEENGISFLEKWVGLSVKNYSSAIGGRPINLGNAIDEEIDEGEPVITLEADTDTGARGPIRLTYTTSDADNKGLGVSFGAFGGSVGDNDSESDNIHLSDYFDLNGDRYPDPILNNKYHLTNLTGGIYDNQVNHTTGVVGASESVTGGQSASGEFTSFSSAPTSMMQSFLEPVFLDMGKGGSVGLFGNMSNGESTVGVLWKDINGDGLKDRLSLMNNNDVTANLNTGAGVESNQDFIHWPNGEILSDNSTHSYGFGMGVNLFYGGSIQAGFSFGRTKSNTDEFLQDINGDGLVDYINHSGSGSNLQFVINTGSEFLPDVAAQNLLTDEDMTSSTIGTHNSLNFALTGGVIIPIPFFCIKVVGNVNTNPKTRSVNNVKKSLEDYDGDGFPDYLEQLNDNQVRIRYSNIRRTNKLKSIETPIGGEYLVDYEVVTPTYDDPNGRWVMNKLNVKDEFATASVEAVTGPGTISKYFKYHNGNYDRREREFLGFGIIRTIDLTIPDAELQQNPTVFESSIYRQSISVLHNESYYTAGKAKESYMVAGPVDFTIDLAGVYTFDFENASKYSRSTNTYELRDVVNTNDAVWLMSTNGFADGLMYDVGGTKGLGRAFCILTNTTSESYELGDTPITLNQTYDYNDPYGRLTSVNHNGDYTSTMEYYTLASKNILGIPQSITVVANGVEKRKREVTEINTSTGQIRKIETSLTDMEASLTEMSYDIYGNLTKVISPEDQNQNQAELIYTYDTEVHQYITQIENKFNYDGVANSFISKNQDYDFKLGTVGKVVDLSDINETRYTYDKLGRVLTILGPKEIESGALYTIEFDYHPYDNNGADRPYATTNHFDPEHNGNDIETVTIGNGLGSAIQVKKDITLFSGDINGNHLYSEHMSVSGISKNDIYGRPIIQYQPNFEAKGNNFDFNTSLFSNHTTSTEYDALDRPTLIEMPREDHNTNITYGLEGSLAITRVEVAQSNNATMIAETLNDANGNKVEHRNIGTPQGTITTTFDYDGIYQLSSYTNDENQTTSFIYDMAGRTIERSHPDAGIETYAYDHLNNLIQKHTPNLAGTSGIEFEYDAIGRVHKVQFPDVGGVNNVNTAKYTYYGSNAGNNTSKLKYLEDATGVQEFQYGNMGEVTENIRTIIAPDMPTRQFKTNFTYDTWGRMKTIDYPDGEAVSYGYDLGGKLRQIIGQQDSDADLPFVNFYIQNIGYDHFGQMVYCENGNGTKEYYTYESDLRRMQNKTAFTPTDELLNNSYDYDFVGNITSIQNTAGAQANGLGGLYTTTYSYDNLNRLTGSNSSWGYNDENNSSTGMYTTSSLSMNYDNIHRILTKTQMHENFFFEDQEMIFENSYEHDYVYGNMTRPNQLTSITTAFETQEEFTYDLNGNMKTHNTLENPYNNFNAGSKQMVWDELNLMKGIVVDEVIMQHYIYDAGGERVLKASGNIETVIPNGGDPIEEAKLDNYTTYPSGFLTVSPTGNYTKHYYAGAKRLASRLAGNADFAPSSIPGTESATLSGRQMADLEFFYDEVELGEVLFNNPDNEVLDCDDLFEYGTEEWKQCKCENGNCPDGEEVIYFFHTDHLGSASYLTDANGEAYQFLMYLPFGESMVEQKAATFSTPYQFNGKELDSETGLYNYGARYYDPRISIWTGVDPLADMFAGWTPYNYTMNNPVNMIDPDGRTAIRIDDSEMGISSIGNEIIKSPPRLAFSKALGNALFNFGIDQALYNLHEMGIDKYGSTLKYRSTSFKPLIADKISGNTSRDYPFHNVELDIDGTSVVIDEIQVILRADPELAIISNIEFGEREASMFNADGDYSLYLVLKGASDPNSSYDSNMRIGKCMLSQCNADNFASAMNSVRIKAVESVLRNNVPKKYQKRVWEAWNKKFKGFKGS